MDKVEEVAVYLQTVYGNVDETWDDLLEGTKQQWRAVGKEICQLFEKPKRVDDQAMMLARAIDKVDPNMDNPFDEWAVEEKPNDEPCPPHWWNKEGQCNICGMQKPKLKLPEEPEWENDWGGESGKRGWGLAIQQIKLENKDFEVE